MGKLDTVEPFLLSEVDPFLLRHSLRALPRMSAQRNAMTYQRKIGYETIRHVQRIRRVLSDGRQKHHFYHRPTRTKLPGSPGSPEFIAAYKAAEQNHGLRRTQKFNEKRPDQNLDLEKSLLKRDLLFFAKYGWRHG